MEPAPQPFEGYDDLSAKDVVERMKTLSANEIEAVKQYESENQDRSTITSFGVSKANAKAKVRKPPKGRPPLVEVAEQAAAIDAQQDPAGAADGTNASTDGGGS